MSILPSKDLRSASSSSSRAPYLNPNSNHGLFFSHPDQQEKPPPNPKPQASLSPPLSPSYATRPLRSLQISNSAQMFDKITEAVAPTAENSGGSSKKVNESGKSNRKKFASPQNNGKDSPNNSISRGSLRPAQHRDKLPETVISPPSQSISGSANCQASSTLSSGRKPQVVNGNHLLNFHYDPISRPQPRAPPPRRHHKRKPYNKDLFLQANYKFVVLDSGNYAPDLLDPDKMLRWEDIICVKFSTPFAVQCPICLDDPLCPQITSCGHIFCFPCILRYFSIGEDDYNGECWKKCPLCFMMVSSKDLYTIYIENVKQHCVGDTAEFMLLTRRKDSLTLSLKNKQGPGNDVEGPVALSKFTFTSDVDLSVRKAISDLDSWLAKADAGLVVDDMEKLPYVCAALEQLEQRRKYWGEQQVGQGSMPSKWKNVHMGSKGLAQNADHANTSNEPSKLVLGSISTGGNGKSEWMGVTTPDQLNGEICLDSNVDVELLEDQESDLSSSYGDIKIIQSNTDGFMDTKEKDFYNFYQVVDGQHIILHPLNMKCLLHHYGSYDRLPHRIIGKILQLETMTQSEAMRRRYRFLSHFSLTTIFQLCEIDLCQLLPPDAVSPFMDEIKKREKQRKQLAKKEQEEKIKAEAALMQCIPASLSFARCSQDIPPVFSIDDFEALGSSSVTSLSLPTVGERKLFSNVARLGFAAGKDSPALKIDVESLCNREIISDSTGLRNAGTASFADVISRAKTSEGEGLENGPPKLSEMAKKGKKQGKVLLSTASGRRY